MSTVRSRGRAPYRDAEPKPRSDAYTGLLLLALLAQIAGVTFLALDWMQYRNADGSTEPPKVAPLAASPAASPAPAPPGNPVPPGGNPVPPGGNPVPPG